MGASYCSTVQREGQAHPQCSRRDSVRRCRRGIQPCHARPDCVLGGASRMWGAGRRPMKIP